MNKALIALAMMFALTGCTDSDFTQELLESQGYTEVRTLGHSFWSCAKDDTFATKFEATNPSGHKVKGTVCSSFWIKDATIRFSK